MDINDATTVSSVKQEIRALKKQKADMLASTTDRPQLAGIRRKIKLLKRLTRQLSRKAAAAPASTGQPAPTA